MSERAAGTAGGDTAPTEFDEAAYVMAFPKIGEAIRAGLFKSAFDHFSRRGMAENRLAEPRYRKALAAQTQMRSLMQPATASEPVTGQVASVIDTILIADGGTCLVVGWIDDRAQRLTEISLQSTDGQVWATSDFARCRRADAEASIGCPPGTLLGFWALLQVDKADAIAPGSAVLLGCGDDMVTHPARPKLMETMALRDTVFEYLAGASYFGAPVVEGLIQLDGGAGRALLELNETVSSRIVSRAHVERHGPADRAFVASIVVCLYGRLEYVFLQAAFFSAASGADAYEFVYVCNSPELTEGLQREARLASHLYGLSITLVFLPGNAGFGAANNVAVSYARSDRVIMLNPDVFPRDAGWPARHAALLSGLPADQTLLFGAPLFYDDGSLMHGGMFITSDTGLSVKPDGIVAREALRVEHYGKGAPPGTALYRQSRRVPAVTGAFISADRPWFEKLGGFSQAYVFGHYEDADLCLKAWAAGGSVWVHDFPLWHLEGKGSNRRLAHEGGSIVNRWHFTRVWADKVANGFHGPDPAGIRA